MSDSECHPKALGGIFRAAQEPDSSGNSLTAKGCYGITTLSSDKEKNFSQTLSYSLSGGNDKCLSHFDSSNKFKGDGNLHTYAGDRPLDLSVKKQDLTEFTSLSSAVPTIFTLTGDNIFKIPLSPELRQSSSGYKNDKLVKAVSKTFEFSHQAPFLSSQPSVFQCKYHLFARPTQKAHSKRNRPQSRASSTINQLSPQKGKGNHKNKPPMMEPQTPQKQARVETEPINIVPHMIKDEPEESIDQFQNTVHTSSLESPKWYQNFSSVPSNHDCDRLNVTAKAAKELHGHQLYSFPDSSTDSSKHYHYSDSDLTRQFPSASVSNQRTFQRASNMFDTTFGEVNIKQDNTIDSSQHVPSIHLNESKDGSLCQVCGDQAAGFYCGAYICEACKKFFIRASKLKQMKYICLKQKNCVITKETRVHCQYCRFHKCLSLQMCYHKDGQKGGDKGNVQEIPCRVCSAPSSGFHFGALTCEGCKGFFRRMVNEREPGTYTCGKGGKCEVNSMTRNMCKACRYAKCIQIGMCIEASRIGRQPNAVKHAISLEVKKQAAQRESSQERKETKPQNPVNLDEDSNTTTYSFDGHVMKQCASGKGEKMMTVEQAHNHWNERKGQSRGIDQRRNFHYYGWREMRENDIASSSTESLDLVGRTDLSVTSFEAAEYCGANVRGREQKRERFSAIDTQRTNELSAQCYSESIERPCHSINAGISGCDYAYMSGQSSPQVPEPIRHHAYPSSEIQRQHSPHNNMSHFSVERNEVPTQAYRSKAIPIKPNMTTSPLLGSRGLHRERRFSEDLELINLNISMHSDDDVSQWNRGHSYQGQRVLGMEFSGSLPSSWDSTNVYNHQGFGKHPLEYTVKQGPVHTVPLCSPRSEHPSSSLASWEQNQGFTQEESINKDFPIASERSDQQAYYSQDCFKNFGGDIQMDDQSSLGDQHHVQQRNNSYNTYQSQETLPSLNLFHDKGSSPSYRKFNISYDSHAQGFVNPGMIGQSNNYNEEERNHFSESQSTVTVNRKHQTGSSFNDRNRYDFWEADNVSNKDERPFKTPSSIDMRSRSPSPCNKVRAYENENNRSRNQNTNRSSNSSHMQGLTASSCKDVGSKEHEGSESPSVLNSTWKQEGRSVIPYENSLKHRHGSRRSRNPSPYSRGKQSYDINDIGRIAPKSNHSSRNGSLERSGPTFDIDNKSSLSLTNSDPSTELANQSISSRSASVNIEDCNVAAPSVSNPQQMSSSSPSLWNFTNSYLDKEMEICAKILKSISLAEQAKQDTYDAERLKDMESAWELMMDHFNFHAKVMVRYAKKAPGFRDLKLDDQVKLLSGATYNLVLLNHTRSYEPQTGFYNYFNMTKRNWMKILEYCPEFAVLHTHFKHCGIMAKGINLSEKEYAYMSTMILLDDECEGLEESYKVKELRDIFMSAFQDYEIENFPNGSLRLGQMLLRLSEFSQFSMQHNMAVLQVMTKHPTLVIPQLYAEMYS
ncbi:hypothetical protein RRG08_018163 [Elysia crispata]|uniref:Nuclear receptor domain-containing protein n=1 Tax=Elysia crispata TaxID=231223 RepID=A0AAE1AZP4_9GAST|nr:hypothetical protein RRG08_018163 [Elysia crispata]